MSTVLAQFFNIIMIITLFVIILSNSIAYADYTHSWEPRISLPGQCGPLEFYNECGSSCKRDCYTLQFTVSCVNKRCLGGCYCKGGFLRSGKNKRCVKEQGCPKFRKNSSQISEKENELNDLINEMLINILN